MFQAETVDDLTLEQYNVLIAFLNYTNKDPADAKKNKYTTSIVSVPGKPGVKYEDD